MNQPIIQSICQDLVNNLNPNPDIKKDLRFKYASIERAIQIITEQSLYFSSPLDFNDPYECMPAIQKLDAQFNIDSLADKKSQRDYIGHLENEVLGGRKIGIVCLSETDKNTIMYAHYSQNHEGLCLGFEVDIYDSGSARANPFLASKVIYDGTYPVLSGNQDSKEQYKKLFLCKHKDWRYEKEWRIVNFLIEDEKDRLMKFQNDMPLKKVVLGIKTKPYVKRLIKALKIEMNMEFEIYEAKQMHNSFLLNIEKIE